MAGLVVLLGEGRRVRWLAAAPGFAAFMLSLVRAAWGGWVVAMGIIIFTARMKRRMAYLAIIGALAAVAFPLLTVGPIAEAVQARLNTATEIEADSSYRERVDFYGSFAATAFGTPLGVGLGTTGIASRLRSSDYALGDYGYFDSGIMDVFFTFGWLGAVVLLAAVSIAAEGLMATRRNGVAPIGAAIAIAAIAQMIFIDTLVGSSGMLVFPFAAVSIAQSKWAESSASALASRRSSATRRKFAAAPKPALRRSIP
jgi:hypothetical protein